MTALDAAIAARLERWTDERVAERLWAKDGTLWAASGKAPEELTAWLGWLDLPAAMGERITELGNLARAVREDGYRRAAVLGMGGSSLAPEMFSRVFGWAGGPNGNGAASADGLELRICDSTAPDAVRGFRSWAEAQRTLFCVSSKSGSTTEPNAFQAAMGEVAPALDFVAITDPGTSLESLAQSQEFRAIVNAPPDVGGRYSALSVFGLVPAALNGVDLAGLAQRAERMAEACRTPRAADNPGLALGAAIGEAALAGRDKLTILTSPRLAAFGDWAEQLIAESTGKAGRGIVPIVGEAVRPAADYADDRYFVFMTLAGEPRGELGALAGELMERGHAGRHIELADALDIGVEIVRWEVATAAAGMVLEIDPFDQPNVQESKDATKALLEAYRTNGALPEPMPIVSEPGLAVTSDPAVLGDTPVSVDGAIGQLLSLVRPGIDYVAILAYLPMDPGVVERLQAIRARIGEATGAATTLGFGPRFLHSTGQLHKGGPDTGVFLQITADPSKDLPIPGWDESFGTLIAAQALGDLESLQRRGRRALRLNMTDASAGLDRLEAILDGALLDRVELTGDSLDGFVRRYFEEYRIQSSGTRAERVAAQHSVFKVGSRLDELVLSADPADAERAWPVILALVDGAPDEAGVSYVAAGPLEDLIQRHGDLFEDRIVERARVDERFRTALQGVWGWDDVSDSLRDRVFALIGKPSS